ncbi:pyruvate dehydrogenase (acetyl-transferring), homodimeric type [Micromonospora sp. NPDC005367]|uniref:pyruvate dehydrogenase (acetyl-transferring), homodimeric type n=1 Tax=Micromonospora sp. NPDC005367 TaxID=3155590 RepID=UPI0033AA7026
MTDKIGRKQPSALDQIPDRDPEETAEWAASLDAVTAAAGTHRATYLLRRTLEHAERSGLELPTLLETDYINTIPTAAEPEFPGDEEMEGRIIAWNRWNAAAMVSRGSRYGLGGHISTFASAAWLYETGFQHFFRGKEADGSGDQLYIQGHASPGIYARAFLDGRLSEGHLDRFRQEAGGDGLPSYPHPRRLPWLWEFPTVSMGLAPLSAIYQARFNRYLQHRGIKDTSASRVWAFLGDGEMDEPESAAALALAGREGLDNLTFVINCNLQRLDGPVRSNLKIVQELEAQFRAAGWNVIKSLWGSAWDDLFTLDTTGALVRRLREVPDGQFQTYAARDVSYIRDHFFGTDPALAEMAKALTDAKIDECFHTSRAGHEPRKVYAAYRAAVEHRGAPTVILAQTIKGHTLGPGFHSRNANHQMKKLTGAEFRALRDLLELPIPDSRLDGDLMPYAHPGADSPEVRYLYERRAALGGPAPARKVHPVVLPEPPAKPFEALANGSGDFTAAATSYATHGEPMIPFYIFYAMFGWQRTADQIWALADQLGRGFLIGATAGRTTMTGEGLQHADGHSHLIASTNPAAIAYDPAFAYEIAVIVRDGLRRMYGPDAENVFYYLTVYNEPNIQPPMPSRPAVEEGILKGLYRFREANAQDLPADAPRLQLLASGTAVHWALEAQRLLAGDWGVAADVWSATSWSELRRDALDCDAAQLKGEERISYVTRVLDGAPGPVLAVSDWMRAVPDQISQWVPQDWHSIGTDGFGLSDTREAVRRHFGVDPQSIVVSALAALARRGEIKTETVQRARERYRIA